MLPRSRFTNHGSRITKLLRQGLRIVLTLAALRLSLHILAVLLAKRLNPTPARPPFRVPQSAQEVHDRLLVVDLHADPLLWNRDLSRCHSTGHIDVPRLQAGNVALQVFGVVTKVPLPERDLTFARRTDLINLLSVIELWPPWAWFSLMERALHQARRLRRLETRTMGQFTLITSAQGLSDFLASRSMNPRLVAGLLALEGTHALGGNLSNVDAFYDAGFRMMSLTHLFDNDAGGSSLGAQRYGLRRWGRDLIKRLEDRRIIIDLAHASPALFKDVLAVTTGPLLVSHTGVQGVFPHPRNLSDDALKEIAARDGLIGIGFDALFTGAPGITPIADSIQYVAGLVGANHVALGSDFDGTIQPPFDASGMALLTAQLMKQGLGEDDIQKVMGGNAIRFLMQNLP